MVLEVAQALTFLNYPIFCAFLGLCSFYLALSKFWWSTGKAPSTLSIHTQPGSKYVNRVIENCSTLRKGYQPASFWGTSGQAQTFFFGIFGRSSTPEVEGQRYSTLTVDGSTLHYDVYEPKSSEKRDVPDRDVYPYTFFVIPGINNCSENSYVRCFVAYITAAGYRVITFNHLGTLKSEELTGHRIFTYVGTEDMALVVKDVCIRYPHTKLIGCGFSIGATVLIRFLGEKKERREKFLCAASCCQGYDAFIHLGYMQQWTKLRRFYSYAISRSHKRIISRHRKALLPQTSDMSVSSHEHNNGRHTSQDTPKRHFNGFQTEIVYEEHNSNGFSMDRKKSQSVIINERKLWSSTSMMELDNCYTRHILGFDTVEEMYKWMSCTESLDKIEDFPLLFLNAIDDPCVVEECHAIPKDYAENHSKSLFVLTQHGGHVGYYEGGLIPNNVTWMDRLLLEFSEACISAI